MVKDTASINVTGGDVAEGFVFGQDIDKKDHCQWAERVST
jgi:hypothetical protein